MSIDPFAMPVGDPFKKKKDEPDKKSWDEIFTKPKEGGGGGGAGASSARQKAEDEAKRQLEQEFEEDFRKNDKVKDPPPPPKPVVVLSHPKWGGEQGLFGQKIMASVEGAIPKAIEHRTRVTFTVFAIPPNGERDRIGSKDEHIRNGIAEVEIDLWKPHYIAPPGEPLVSCPYFFEVKHSCSTIVISERLHVSAREFCLEDLRDVLETLEQEKGADATRIFICSLNYKSLCDLAHKGTQGNDPNKMPTRFFLLPGADDSKLETTDAHHDEKSHMVSVSNLRKGLIALGYDCAAEGSFDQALQDVFDKYLQSLSFPKQNDATIHKIQKGETLGWIALKYGLHSWKQIYDLNKDAIGSNPDLIKVGKELKIPERNSSRGEQLIRNGGGDLKRLMGGSRYVYPWALFHLNLVEISEIEELEIVFSDRKTGNILWSGKDRVVGALLPWSSEINVGVKGIPLEIAGEKHIHSDDQDSVEF